jgi:hypothetical protein
MMLRVSPLLQAISRQHEILEESWSCTMQEYIDQYRNKKRNSLYSNVNIYFNQNLCILQNQLSFIISYCLTVAY